MKNNSLTPSHRLSKWFLALFVCFGFFAFAGGLSNVQAGQHRAVQTELLVSPAQKSHKKLAFYNKFSPLNKIVLHCSIAVETFVLINHYRSLQTKLKVLQRIYSSLDNSHLFPLKTIPQNFKEGPLPVLIG